MLNPRIFPCENTIHLLDILALEGQGSLFRSHINQTQQESFYRKNVVVVSISRVLLSRIPVIIFITEVHRVFMMG